MNVIIRWVIVVVLSLSSTLMFTNSSFEFRNIEELDVCGSNNNAFQSGEKLTYKIYYNWGLLWLGAGEVVFTVQESQDNYLYKAIGKTFASYSWVFDVDDKFYSFVDKQTLLPVRAKRNINEDGYIIKNDIVFNQEDKSAVSTLIVNNKEPKVIKKQFDYCMYDILSVIYGLRNVDRSSLNKGDKIPFSMMMDDETYPLSIEYVGKVESKKVKNLGHFDAVEVSPSIIKGRVFAKDKRMKVWISDDENNVPLIIESPLSVGKIKVVLQKHEGLKYALVNLD